MSPLHEGENRLDTTCIIAWRAFLDRWLSHQSIFNFFRDVPFNLDHDTSSFSLISRVCVLPRYLSCSYLKHHVISSNNEFMDKETLQFSPSFDVIVWVGILIMMSNFPEPEQSVDPGLVWPWTSSVLVSTTLESRLPWSFGFYFFSIFKLSRISWIDNM